MLGIDSEISIEGEISSLSLVSQQNTSSKTIKIQSTNKASTFDGEDGSPRGLASAKSDKVRALRSRLQNIGKQQEMFENKMKNCVGIIERQVKKKEQQNRQLEQLVKALKEQLFESRADIEVLTNYLVKMKPTIRKQSPQAVNDSHNSYSKNSISTRQKIIAYHPKTGLKDRSPQNRVTLKSSSPVNVISNYSPKGHPQQSKKSSSPGLMVSSPFKRKLKVTMK